MKKVFCWGTFDILHKGHFDFLKFAKNKGDYLTVIVVPDKAVFENKNRFPLNSQNKRAENLKKLKYVDEVLTSAGFNELFKIIVSFKPDIFVFGYDQNKKFADKIINHLKINNINTKACFAKEFAKGIHTSDILSKH